MAGEHARGKRPRRSPGAAPHGEDGAWQRINWSQVDRDVRRLQVRIVKATEEGRWGKVKALQHLLTHSFSGRALAVRRVTGNRGKRTPGVDGQTWTTPARKSSAMHELRQHGYRPKPLRRVYIEKRGTTKKRPLGIPAMKDRAMQALYLLALVPVAETTGDECSYGFRPERSTADAIERCFRMLSQKGSAEWILECDIVSCFDKISHDWLEQHVPMERPILHKWLKAGFMDESVFYPTEEGTPQGGIASPVLANMTLDGLLRALREQFPKCLPGNKPLHRVNLVRYADDLIVTADSKEVLELEVMPLVERFMGERGLELSKKKTTITHIEAGFDFLGQTIRKYGGKLIIKPSKKRVLEFLREVRELIKANNGAPAGLLVAKLNPVIRGWARYHRHVVSSSTFAFVDHEIWNALWRWSLRRHPNKNRGWMRRKYFRSYQGNHWVFTGQTVNAKGEKRDRRIFFAASIPIRRHVPVRGNANPFDPEWSAYFAARHDRKRKESRHDRQRSQEGSRLHVELNEAPRPTTSSNRARTPSSSRAAPEA
jgi:RNA-directed DNA polymerase